MSTFLHPDGLAAAKAVATRGLCIFCEEPALPGKYLCFALKKQPRRGEPGYECFRAWQRAYYRDVRVLARLDAQANRIAP